MDRKLLDRNVVNNYEPNSTNIKNDKLWIDNSWIENIVNNYEPNSSNIKNDKTWIDNSWIENIVNMYLPMSNCLVDEGTLMNSHFITVDTTDTTITNSSLNQETVHSDLDAYKCGFCKQIFNKFFLLSRHNCNIGVASDDVTSLQY